MNAILLRRSMLAYGLALVLPGVALAIRAYYFSSSAEIQPFIILFVPPIAIAALLGGLWPGLIATTVSVALAEYGVAQQGTDAFGLRVGAWLTLGFVGLFITGLLEALHRQRRQIQEARSALEARAEEALESEARFSAVFHAAPVAIMITRLSDGKLIDVNSAFTELWGYTREEVLGRSQLQSDLWLESLPQLIEKLKHSRHSEGQELQVRHQSGEIRSAFVSVSVVNMGTSAHLLTTAVDITERKRAQELEHLAHHDTLTSLPNRLLLRVRLKDALQTALAKGGAGAVLFVDLDRFKEVNDTLGHDAGDELLRLVSARLRARTRNRDLVARLGGDEFVVLLQEIQDLDIAESVAADLIKQLSMPFVLSKRRQVEIGASIGITYFPGESDDADVLMRQADVALYRAKNTGRNRYTVFAGATAASSLTSGT